MEDYILKKETKMILIFSWDEYEQGTQAVEDWFLYYKTPFLKLSPQKIYDNQDKWFFDISSKKVIYGDLNLSKEIHSIWIRKYPIPYNILSKNDESIYIALNKELAFEYKSIADFLMYCLEGKYRLGTSNEISFDKMKALCIAKEVGFKIPDTIITNRVKDLNRFHNSRKIITKQINGCYKNIYTIEGSQYMCLTSEVSINDYQNTDLVFPSLFQEFIPKEKELRVTVVENKIFAAVYINHIDKNYDKKEVFASKNTHIVPYQLDKNTEYRILEFMRRMNLNYGSIDMILLPNETCVFLEINPSGQFLCESQLCNFGIDKYIADLLIEHDK